MRLSRCYRIRTFTMWSKTSLFLQSARSVLIPCLQLVSAKCALRAHSLLAAFLFYTIIITMWRQARRGHSVDTWISERTSIFEANADHELPMASDEPDPTFTFNFNSLNRAPQQTLFQYHDRHRRDLNALWAARDHLEGMNAQYRKWKTSHKLPRFLSKMQIPSKIVGSRCPTSFDPRGKKFGEFVAELDDQDVDRNIEILM